MKKTLLTILALLLCIPLLFSCADQFPKTSAPQTGIEETLTQDTIPASSTPKKRPPKTVPPSTLPPVVTQDPSNRYSLGNFKVVETELHRDGKHIGAFNFIQGAPLVSWGFITLEQWNDVTNLFEGTISFSYGLLVDYFGITREEYEAALEQALEESGCVGPTKYTIYTHIWFSEDYEDHPRFLHPDYVPPENPTVRMRPEGDTTHIGLYHSIDSALIEYVGVDRFNAYKEKFGGTEDFNIIHFVDYFDIDKEEYLTLYPNRLRPYLPEAIYGDKEMQELYFCRHDIHEK